MSNFALIELRYTGVFYYLYIIRIFRARKKIGNLISLSTRVAEIIKKEFEKEFSV